MMRQVVTAALAAAAVATPAAAKDLVYGSFLGTSNQTHERALLPYFEMVREATDGEINWELVPGGQLADPAGTPEAVGSNLMDAGMVMAPYQPRMLPATNLIFSQSLVGDDFLASVGAMNETVMLNCEECHEDFAENDAVAFAGYGVTPYLFMCRGDVSTLDDLKTRKVRASGGGVAIVNRIGGTVVSMPPTEATSALERGTIDCVLGGVAWLRSYGYIDVVGSVIEAPMGMGGPPMMMYTNRGVWEDMTPEQRQVHIDLAPDLVTMTVYDAQRALDEEVRADAHERDITFHEGGAPFEEIMAAHDEAQYEMNVENARSSGVEDPEAILDAYLAAYERWKGLIEEHGDDRETYRQLLWDEVYSKVDPEAL